MEEDKTYYYFIDGYDKVLLRKEYICDGDGSHNQYHELSNEQTEWFLAHPTASAHEVKQLCTDQELAWKGISLERYKQVLCGNLSKIAESRMEQLVPHDKMSDALLYLSGLAGGDASLEEPYKDRVRYYREIRETAKKEMARVRLRIAAATSHKEAEEAYDSHHLMDIKTGKESWNE